MDRARARAVLGVAENASEADLKRAWRSAARRYHPDHNKEPDAEAKFKEAALAYDVLTGKVAPPPPPGASPGAAPGATGTYQGPTTQDVDLALERVLWFFRTAASAVAAEAARQAAREAAREAAEEEFEERLDALAEQERRRRLAVLRAQRERQRQQRESAPPVASTFDQRARRTERQAAEAQRARAQAVQRQRARSHTEPPFSAGPLTWDPDDLLDDEADGVEQGLAGLRAFGRR